VIARRFLAWARIAPACARADATSALARAYLYAVMDEDERYEAEIALTAMLDDPSPLVHRAMAEALASAAAPPRHLIIGLVALGGEAAALCWGAPGSSSRRAGRRRGHRQRKGANRHRPAREPAGDRRSGARRVGGLVPAWR